MGNHHSEELTHSDADEPEGLRVLSVQRGSPASEAETIAWDEPEVVDAVTPKVGRPGTENPRGLVAFFDILVSINGRRVTRDLQAFVEQVAASEDSDCELEVWNTHAARMRVVRLTPRRWAGNGLLGAYVRYVSYLGSHDDVLQVIDVLSHSPAALAGLVPDLDFILGADDAVFESVDEFGAFLADRQGSSVLLTVYNATRDSVREVPLFLTEREWGGGHSGIGCTVAHGVIHALPRSGGLGRNEWVTDTWVRGTGAATAAGTPTEPAEASPQGDTASLLEPSPGLTAATEDAEPEV